MADFMLFGSFMDVYGACPGGFQGQTTALCMPCRCGDPMGASSCLRIIYTLEEMRIEALKLCF